MAVQYVNMKREKNTLDKLTEAQAEELVAQEKARFLDHDTNKKVYLIHQSKLYIKRADGYFPHYPYYLNKI